jgi:hypothetical protein
MAEDWQKRLYAGWNGQGKSGGGPRTSRPPVSVETRKRDYVKRPGGYPDPYVEGAFGAGQSTEPDQQLTNVMLDHPAPAPQDRRVGPLDGTPALPGRSELDPGILGRAANPGRDRMPQPSVERLTRSRVRGKA